MKKKLTFAAIAAMTSFSLIAVIFSSIAWFNTKTTIENTSQLDHLGGESDGAYFGGGDGSSADDAYIISTPRHLYNLAWLQYLGWFNGNDNGVTQGNSNATLPTVYFKVTADLNMNGWTLPPIGTTQYPFIGNFNGQGHVISNLATINSANINNYNKVPTPVRNAGTVTNVNVVGFFGVVGEINNNIPAAYSTAANQVTNFTLNTYTAKSYTANTLIGMAAGYVNGTLSNVGITGTSDVDVSNQTTSNYSYTYGTGQSAVTKTFTNISNYGVVGYAEDAYKKTIEKTVTNNYNPVYTQDEEGFDAGGGLNAAWGGSVNMQSAYAGIRKVWDSAYGITIGNGSNYIYYDTASGTFQNTTNATTAAMWGISWYGANGGASNVFGFPFVITDEGEFYIGLSGSSIVATTNINNAFCFYNSNGFSSYPVSSTLMNYGSQSYYLQYYNGNWRRNTSGTTCTATAQTKVSNYDGTYEDSANNTYTKIQNGFYQYNSGRTIVKDINNTTTSDTRQYSYVSDPASLSFNGYYSNNIKNSNNQITSSYTFRYTSGNNYMYLYGDEKKSVSNGLTTTTTQYNDVNVSKSLKIYFTDPSTSTKYYLYRSSGETLSQTSSETTATTWYVDSNRYIYTVDNSTADNATRYYLRYNSGNASLVSTTSASVATNATQFTWDNTRSMYYYSSGGTSYYLYYDVANSAWKFQSGYNFTYDNYYKIYNANNGTSYLGINGTSINSSAVTEANAAHWIRESYTSNNSTRYRFYVMVNSTKYYLCYSSNNNPPTLNTSSTTALYTTTNSTSTSGQSMTLQYKTSNYSTTTYRLRYNNGWTITNSNSSIYMKYTSSSMTLPMTYASQGDTSYKEKRTTSSTSTTYYQTKPTFFPLSQQETSDTDSTPNGIPADQNTGYVISGGSDSSGDIRVSRYDLESLQGYSGDSSGINLDTVYTINGTTQNGSNSIEIDDDMAETYQRYDAAKRAQEKVLKDYYGKIYGLHFMGSQIEYGIHNGVDRSVYAGYAKVNGEEYTNYELPRSCIDFNLKEKGYINFIAGAYFKNNNCFFTLNKVYRNSSQKITDIKNIREIYSDGIATHGIIFKFDDNTYTVPYKIVNGEKKNWAETQAYVESTSSNAPTTYSTSYAKVFDCSWIDTAQTLKATEDDYEGYPYYFELPVNDGEYCMGSPSFSNAAGAYLMYLDIGANAKKMYRTTVYEVITKIEEEFELPTGVGIIVSGGTVSDMNSYCVTIESSYNGKVTFNRTSSSAATYTESVASANVYLSYKHDDIAVNTNEVATPLSIVETTYERITFYDFSPSVSSTIKTVLTRTTVVTNGDTQHASTNYSCEQWSGYTNTSAGTPVTGKDVFIYDAEGFDITATYSTVLDFDILEAGTCGAVIYTVRNIYTPEGVLTITFVLTTSSTVTDVYTLYTVTGYNISITLTKADGVPQNVTVTDECTVTYDNHGTYTITINGQTYTVNVPQTITVSS